MKVDKLDIVLKELREELRGILGKILIRLFYMARMLVAIIEVIRM